MSMTSDDVTHSVTIMSLSASICINVCTYVMLHCSLTFHCHIVAAEKVHLCLFIARFKACPFLQGLCLVCQLF